METQELLDTFHETFRQINKRLEELEKVHTRYTGPRGPAGKDAPSPKIVIGTVTIGDQADARIRTVDGTFVLDLCLPRGTDGRDGYSNLPGPPGRNGADAVTTIAAGQVVSGREAMASLRHEGDVVILDLVLPRGPQGEVGEIGPPGRDVKLRLGEVVSGSTANARLREDGPSSYVLDLCLPKGDRGDPGIGERGPQGLPGIGQVGPKGDGPTKEELSIPIRQVINENPEQFRGPMGYGRDGRDGVGIRGPQGKPGDISAAVAQAEAEARSVVQEALVEIQAQLERLERATK